MAKITAAVRLNDQNTKEAYTEFGDFLPYALDIYKDGELRKTVMHSRYSDADIEREHINRGMWKFAELIKDEELATSEALYHRNVREIAPFTKAEHDEMMGRK